MPDAPAPQYPTYADRCRAAGVDHFHCPYDHSHPQPTVLADGRFVCGRCLFMDEVITEMVPCSPAAGYQE